MKLVSILLFIGLLSAMNLTPSLAICCSLTSLWEERIQDENLNKMLNEFDSNPRWSGFNIWIDSAQPFSLKNHYSGSGSGEYNEYVTFSQDGLKDVTIEVGNAELVGIGPDDKNVTTGYCNITIDNSTELVKYSAMKSRSGKTKTEYGEKYVYKDKAYATALNANKFHIFIKANGFNPDEVKSVFESLRIKKIYRNTTLYYLNLANMYYDNKSYSKALSFYERVIELDHDCILAHNKVAALKDLIGMEFCSAGDYDKCVAFFRTNEPQSADAWHTYGTALTAIGQEEEAEYAFDEENVSKKSDWSASIEGVLSTGLGQGGPQTCLCY